MDWIKIPAVYLGLCISLTTLAFNLYLFIAARLLGVRVLEVSIFFNKMVRVKRKNLNIQVGYLPIGGYVKMDGMLAPDPKNDTFLSDSDPDDPALFRNKSLGKRLAIMGSGFLAYIFVGVFGLLLIGDSPAAGWEMVKRGFELLLFTFPAKRAGLELTQLFHSLEPVSLFMLLMACTGLFMLITNLIPYSSSMGHALLRQFRKDFATTPETGKNNILGMIFMFPILGGLGYLAYRFIAMFGFVDFLLIIANYLVAGLVFAVVCAVIVRLLGKPDPTPPQKPSDEELEKASTPDF